VVAPARPLAPGARRRDDLPYRRSWSGRGLAWRQSPRRSPLSTRSRVPSLWTWRPFRVKTSGPVSATRNSGTPFTSTRSRPSARRARRRFRRAGAARSPTLGTRRLPDGQPPASPEPSSRSQVELLADWRF